MESNYVVKYEGGLIQQVGKVIATTNKLLAINAYQLIPFYKKYTGWGFCSLDKSIVIECDYYKVCLFTEELACVQITIALYTYKWGYINRKGEIVIPFIYDSAVSFSNGLGRVMKDEKWGLIDKNGNQVTEFIYDKIEDYSEGFARVIINEKYGLIDIGGKVIISPIYGWIACWFGGHFTVTTPEGFIGRFGIIDSEENIIIPLIYTVISRSDDIYVALLGNETGKYIVSLFDKFGSSISSLNYENVSSFSEDLAYAKINDKYGYIDKNGNPVIEFIFDKAISFLNGFAGVNLKGKWGFIDKKGMFIIPCIYSDIFQVQQNWEGQKGGVLKELINVKLNNKWGFIDNFGNKVIDFDYEETYDFSNGLARVKKLGKYGYINKLGIIVIPCIYDKGVIDFTNGYGRVELNGKSGLVDNLGNIIIPCIYDEINNFSDGLARVKLDKEFGFVNWNGSIAIPIVYKNAEDFSGGLAKVSVDVNLMGYISKSGVEYWEY